MHQVDVCCAWTLFAVWQKLQLLSPIYVFSRSLTLSLAWSLSLFLSLYYVTHSHPIRRPHSFTARQFVCVCVWGGEVFFSLCLYVGPPPLYLHQVPSHLQASICVWMKASHDSQAQKKKQKKTVGTFLKYSAFSETASHLLGLMDGGPAGQSCLSGGWRWGGVKVKVGVEGGGGMNYKMIMDNSHKGVQNLHTQNSWEFSHG